MSVVLALSERSTKMLRHWLRALGLPALVLGTLLLAAAPASAGILGWAIAARVLSNVADGYYYEPYYYYGPYGGPYGDPYYWIGYSSPWGYRYDTYYVPRTYRWEYYPQPGTYYSDQQPMDRRDYTSFYPSEQANQVPQKSALIKVHVPPGAELWFGGDKTTQTGEFREFVTPDLKQNQDYFYTVKARWMQNGEQTEKTRRVRVHPGSQVTVDFFRAPTSGERMQQPAKQPEKIAPKPEESSAP
jgi:uncharacterized protein (TIGR03000 family)